MKSLLLLALPAAAAMCAPSPRLRVCTFGGEGSCSAGDGAATLEALRFLSPPDGPECVGCSCLARCDRGVAVQDEASGSILEEVTGVPACAALLGKLGHAADARLVEAYETAAKADALAAADAPLGGSEEARTLSEALKLYKRAFTLAISAGLGLRWRRRAEPAAGRAAGRGPAFPALSFIADAGALLPGAGSSLGEGRGRANPVAVARLVTPAQVRWLASVMTRRSRLYARLAAGEQALGLEQRREFVRSLEDARYAVQLAESTALGRSLSGDEVAMRETAGAPGMSAVGVGVADAWRGADGGADEVLTEAWERLAEAYEATRDIEGAIFAYDRLLELEPPFSAGLSPAVSAKRGVQELVLISHRRGLEDVGTVTSSLQAAGEVSRRKVTDRALRDVEALRNVVERDLRTVEATVERDLPLAEATGEGQAAGEAAEGTTERDDAAASGASPNLQGQLASWAAGTPLGSELRSRFALRSREDLRVVRKIALGDINRLQLALLQGDPTLAYLRRVFRLGERSEGTTSISVSASSEQAFWLRQQYESGALPDDPVLLTNLLEQAKRDPDLVERLVREAKDARGKDLAQRGEGGVGAEVDEAADQELQ